jgi:hypothetical protein
MREKKFSSPNFLSTHRISYYAFSPYQRVLNQRCMPAEWWLKKYALIPPTPAGRPSVHPDYPSLRYTSDWYFSAMTHGHLLGRAPTAAKNTHVAQKIAHFAISALQGRSLLPLQQIARLRVEQQFRPASKLHAVDDARRLVLSFRECGDGLRIFSWLSNQV